MKDQELVNALRYLCPGNFTCARCEYEPVCHGDGCAIIQKAADRIANQSTHIAALQQKIEKLRGQVPRWIPVDERLPEVWRNDETAELVNYMIYSPDFGVDIGNYHAKAKKWLCMALPCTVTHWAPLPEPPEVE